MERLRYFCRIRHLMAAVAVIALILALDSIDGGRACGEYELKVDLHVPAGRKLVAVTALPVTSLETAKDLVHFAAERNSALDPVLWVQGQTIGVRIPCGSRRSYLSERPLHPWQWQGLMLCMDFDDGKRGFYAWPVPDRNRTRRMSVSVP